MAAPGAAGPGQAGPDTAGEVHFYHLTRSPAEHVLAELLRRSLERGWRALVRGTDRARLERLDEWLWLHPDEGFLPHGLAGGPHDARQPVLLTDAPGPGANRPDVVFLIDGAAPDPAEARSCRRLCLLFAAAEAGAVEAARAHWRAVCDAGLAAFYWSEESGRWECRRRHPPAGD